MAVGWGDTPCAAEAVIHFNFTIPRIEQNQTLGVVCSPVYKHLVYVALFDIQDFFSGSERLPIRTKNDSFISRYLNYHVGFQGKSPSSH